jgi:hypothetical protein
MKTTLALALAPFFLAGSLVGQLSSLPPSSIIDGVPVKAIGPNAGSAHWEDPAGLGAYRTATAAELRVPAAGPDSVRGITWTSSRPASLDALLYDLNAQAGILRALAIGETAKWINDFGYAYDGQPQGSRSFTVFQNIQQTGPGATLHFGDYVDLALGIGEAQRLDFWLNGSGGEGSPHPTPPTEAGGVFTLFDPSNSSPFTAPGNVRWAQTPLLVNTWAPALGTYVDVPTYLVAIEDWRLDRGSDADYSDLLIGLQVYTQSGTPFEPVPVPEPAELALSGGIALLAIAAHRRLTQGGAARQRP